jgi:hypothetical protein
MDSLRAALLSACDLAVRAEDALREQWDAGAAADLQDALRHASTRLASLDNNIDRLRQLNRQAGP